MKLIYAQGACSLSVHILLEELKLNYEGIKVSLKDKKVLESYNPKSYVPVLILDDGSVMTEATSILQYVSHENHGAFLPQDSFARGKCIEWLTYISTELHKGAMPLFYKKELPEKFIGQIMLKIDKRLSFMEEQLMDQAFIINNSYTIADMYAVAILRLLEHADVKLDVYPEITNYKRTLEASPVIKQVIKAEAGGELATEINEEFFELNFFHRQIRTRTEIRKQ